jgi:hypothetical protein
MIKGSPGRRFLSVVIFISFIIFNIIDLPKIAGAQQEPKTIKLKPKFLRSLRFTYGDEEEQKVFKSSGFRFSPEFEDVMSQHPKAIRAAKGSFYYNGIAMAGTTIMLLIPIVNLLDAIKKAKDVSDNKPVDNSIKFNDLVPTIVIGYVSLGFAAAGTNQLRRGVQLFNEKEDPQNLTNWRRQFNNMGFNFELTSSTISNRKTFTGLGSNIGIGLGFYKIYNVSNYIGIQPEFQINMKGYKFINQEISGWFPDTETYSYTHTYLEFPLLVRVSIPTHTKLSPYVMFGPSLGIRAFSYLSIDGEQGDMGEEPIKTIDWGMMTGVGLKFADSPFTLEIRNTSGISSIYKKDADTGRVLDVKNRVTTFNFGYMFW